MYLSILFLPLLSFLVLGFFGYKLGNWGSVRLSIGCLGMSFFLSCFCFYEIGLNNSISHIKLFSWFSILNFKLHWGFLFDSLTCGMLLVVTSISFLVHIYSSVYMDGDPHLVRFMSYLSLFTFFMLCLVTGDNFLQLFLGWEGVGVSSYLLITS
jgi:NADH-ubiquinone oxidoreductase chain 5